MKPWIKGKRKKGFFLFLPFFLLAGSFLCEPVVNARAATTTYKLNIRKKSIVKDQEFTLRVKRLSTEENVVYSVKDPSIASVSDTGSNKCTVKGLAVGATKIYATVFRDGQQLKQLQCTLKVTPNAASVRFRISSLELEIGETDDLMRVLSVKPKNTAEIPAFTVSDPSVVQVFKDGTIEALKSGTATVTATIASGRKDSLLVKIYEAEDAQDRERYQNNYNESSKKAFRR